MNLGYKISHTVKANINVSISSRAPHVNELLSGGIHHGTATYELGNVNLKTEKSFNLAGTVQYLSENKVMQAEVSVYRNSIHDFNYRYV